MPISVLLWVTFGSLFFVLLIGRAYTERRMVAVKALESEAAALKRAQDEEVCRQALRNKLLPITVQGVLRISRAEKFYWEAPAKAFRLTRGEYVQDVGVLAFSNMRVVFDSPRGMKQYYMDEIEKVTYFERQFKIFLYHRPVMIFSTDQADASIYFGRIHEEYLTTLHLQGWNRYFSDR
jgi:hypothetical protein